MRLILTLTLSLLSTLCLAGPIENYVELFKDKGYDWENSGNVCEFVAQEEMKTYFPEDKYEIKSGITYKFKNQVIGELDLIVFNRSTNMVDFIGEIKCWKEPGQGYQKALDQRERFKRFVGRAVQIQDHERIYDNVQFRSVQGFFSVAQKGTKSYGFTYEISLTLKEAHDLRTAMLRCQNSGQCLKP